MNFFVKGILSWICVFRGHVEERMPFYRPWYGGQGVDTVECSRCGIVLRIEYPTEEKGTFMCMESTENGLQGYYTKRATKLPGIVDYPEGFHATEPKFFNKEMAEYDFEPSLDIDKDQRKKDKQ